MWVDWSCRVRNAELRSIEEGMRDKALEARHWWALVEEYGME